MASASGADLAINALKALSPGAYCIVKNPDARQSLERGGDIDLVVKDRAEAYLEIVEYLGMPSRVTRRSYLWKLHFQWGEIDLTSNIEWRGIVIRDGPDILEQSAKGDAGLFVASRVDQAIAGCIYPLLAHASYKSRYRRLLEALDPEEVSALEGLLAARGMPICKTDLHDSERFDALSGRLRRGLVMYAAKSPIRSLRRFAEFGWAETGLRRREG